MSLKRDSRQAFSRTSLGLPSASGSRPSESVPGSIRGWHSECAGGGPSQGAVGASPSPTTM